MISVQSAAHLSDDSVLSETRRLAQCEQAATADLVTMLAELDARQLFFRAGYGSLFSYCMDELHLSEDATYTRIEVARVSRVFPRILQLLREGSLSLTNARLLAPVLTASNAERVLRDARHKRKRDVELMIATLRPQPDVPAVVRKLAEPAAAPPAPLSVLDPQEGSSSALPVPEAPRTPASPVPVVRPLSPARFKIQFTADEETHALLRRAQALGRHRLPSGDVAEIFKRALKLLVGDLERVKAGVVSKPRGATPARRGSRYIPRHVRRAVWKRDRAQCTFEGPRGRCAETDFLEFHHVRPFAHGGPTTIENLELRCRAHNVLEHQAMLE